METPNTRSRQKREAGWPGPSDSQEETGRIRWVSADQKRLKKMMAEAEADKEIRLPEPSQKPAFFHNPPSAGGPSSARPRKRPCRGNRSLPSHSLSTGSMDLNIGERSNSAPVRLKTEDDVELDELLNLAMKTISVKASFISTTPLNRINKSQKENSKSEYSMDGGSVAGSSSEQGLKDESSAKQKINALQEQQINNPSPRRSARQTPSKLHKPKVEQYSTQSQSPLIQQRPTVPGPTSTSTTHGLPRMGLAAPKSSNLFVKQPKPISVRPNQAFKPPLLHPQQHPIRSSPRRIPSINNTPSRPDPSSSSLVVPALPKHVDKQDPSSDSIGDESFDSFDGMIEGGGEDVVALLRTLDGTQ